MSYGEFTLDGVARTFQLSIEETADLFGNIEGIEIGAHLAETLKENVPLAVAVSTEKVRSELIVAPILVEVRKLLHRKISLFSGVEFNVDSQRGLNGVCDFLLSRSSEQLYVRAPAVAIVEAKNDNIKSGLGQCAAEMVAAVIFNEREGNGPRAVHGVVTTGSLWRFLRLEGQTLSIDLTEYPLAQVGKIIGILLAMLTDPAPAP